ncbi:MAG: hypothetical protein NTV46_17475 [Verrucomicrobia bacterium]|nr:hypothetical protein [Verrucomicrobiota bacterium]
MTRPSLTLSVLAIVAGIGPASAGITFGPVRSQPGESVRLVTHSETPGGTLERSLDGKPRKGTITITRDRELTWTFRDPAADGTKRGMVRVTKLTTSSKSVIAGKEEKSTDSIPLTGKMFAMSKPPKGAWKFELDGSVPYTRVTNEIDELTVYLQRAWWPAREINLGDSWEFDPAWIKMIIEKDLAKAQTIGTMRLRQIRRGEKRQIAIIDVTVRSTGADFQADGSEASAAIELTGQITVNLDTMLDESLELKGTLTSNSSKPGESTKLKLPISLVVTKSFVIDGPMP